MEREFFCEKHPKLRPDFLCLAKDCNYLLLCHECTLNDLDHAKIHGKSMKPCENLWKILQKTRLSQDSVQENLTLSRIKAGKIDLKEIVEENIRVFERKVQETVEILKKSLRNRLEALLSSLNPEEKPKVESFHEFFSDLQGNSQSLDEQKAILRGFFAKYEKNQEFPDYNSEILELLSRKTAQIKENTAKYFSNPESFHENLRICWQDFEKMFDFPEKSADFAVNASQTPQKSRENEQILDTNDQIPTFSRFHQAKSLENNALDAFGKVTLIQTIDCGHQIQEKLSEGVIISQVSVVEIDNRVKVITCSKDKTLRIFDFLTNRLENVVKGHSDWVYRFVFFEENANLVSGSIDKSLRLWGFSLEKQWKCLKTVACESSIISLTKVDSQSFTFSMRNHGLKLMSKSLEIVSQYKFPHDKEIWTVLPFFKGNQLFLFLGVVDGAIAILYYESRQRTLTLVNLIKECHASIIFDMILYENQGKQYMISSSGDTCIKIWEIHSGVIDFKLNLARTWKAHEGFIRKILVYRGNLLVSCADDASLKFWRLNDGKLVQTIKKAHGAAIYWLGKFNEEIIFTAGEDNCSVVKFWQ